MALAKMYSLGALLLQLRTSVFSRFADNAKAAGLLELACLSREERQDVYGEILKENGGCMTPTQVSEELERRGMTFAFVGQDMAAMRTMPCIQIEARGQYRWNGKFFSVSETRKPKRQRSGLKDVQVVEEESFSKLSKAISGVGDEGKEEGLVLLLSVALFELEAQPPSFIVCSREIT